MKALINMSCELKITSGSKKKCVKIPWRSDIPLKSYQRKTVLRGLEIHSSNAKSLACDTVNEHALTCTKETCSCSQTAVKGINGKDLYIHITTVGNAI